MKKKSSKICKIASIVLILVFIVKLIFDYITYKTTLNSAPFYLWIIVDAIYFLAPAVVMLIIGLV